MMTWLRFRFMCQILCRIHAPCIPQISRQLETLLYHGTCFQTMTGDKNKGKNPKLSHHFPGRADQELCRYIDGCTPSRTFALIETTHSCRYDGISCFCRGGVCCCVQQSARRDLPRLWTYDATWPAVHRILRPPTAATAVMPC